MGLLRLATTPIGCAHYYIYICALLSCMSHACFVCCFVVFCCLLFLVLYCDREAIVKLCQYRLTFVLLPEVEAEESDILEVRQ